MTKLVLVTLLAACSSPKQPVAPSNSVPTTGVSIEDRADAFVAAWRRAKAGQGSSIEPLLAERVTLTIRHASDEEGPPPQVVARPGAAKALVNTIESFSVGERKAYDARCCTFDTNGQRGDLVSAIERSVSTTTS